MDMDRDSLELMLNLLDTDCNIKTALEGHRELAKNKQKVDFCQSTCFSTKPFKVIDICTEMKAAGHAGSLNIDLLSADHLAMETLLRFFSYSVSSFFFNRSFPLLQSYSYVESEFYPISLFSMTSKRAGEWFKEELRELGGLGHLAR